MFQRKLSKLLLMLLFPIISNPVYNVLYIATIKYQGKRKNEATNNDMDKAFALKEGAS
jgi:hypothetical protein